MAVGGGGGGADVGLGVEGGRARGRAHLLPPGHFGLRFFDSSRVLFRVCLSAWKYICTNTLHKT